MTPIIFRQCESLDTWSVREWTIIVATDVDIRYPTYRDTNVTLDGIDRQVREAVKLEVHG